MSKQEEQSILVLTIKYGSFGDAFGHWLNGNESDFNDYETKLFKQLTEAYEEAQAKIDDNYNIRYE